MEDREEEGEKGKEKRRDEDWSHHELKYYWDRNIDLRSLLN